MTNERGSIFNCFRQFKNAGYNVLKRGYKNVLIDHFRNVGVLMYSIRAFVQFSISSII